MSADGWSKCPICENKKDKIRKEKYGKVSPEEYEDLISKFSIEESENKETVREDFNGGPYFDGDDNWCFKGKACCDVCGAEWGIDVKAKLKKE